MSENPQPIILLVENEPLALRGYARLLKHAGYLVIPASSYEEARQHLDTSYFHLAILDNRLRDQDDEKDMGGFLLARQSDPAIPKIIFTAFPTWELARDALTRLEQGAPAAVDFVYKKEGPEVLLDHVRRALVNRGWNWQLNIEWKAGDPVWVANRCIGANSENIPQVARAVEDLFRAVFRSQRDARVARVIYEKPGRVVLMIDLSGSTSSPETCLLVLGKRNAIEDEVRRFHELAPKVPYEGSGAILASDSAGQVGAIAYVYSGLDLNGARTLGDVCAAGGEKTAAAGLRSLLSTTLPAWHGRKEVIDECQQSAKLYRSRSGEPVADLPMRVEQALIWCKRELASVGMQVRDTESDTVVEILSHSFRYPKLLENLQPVVKSAGLRLTGSPGALNIHSVLISAAGVPGITDFSTAGVVGELWDFISLEASIRFDVPLSARLLHIRDFEEALSGTHFTRLDDSGLETVLRRYLRLVQAIRVAASESVGKQAALYHLGMLYESLTRLVDATSDAHTNSHEVARVAHLLLAALAISARLALSSSPTSSAGKAGITIDDAGAVFVDGFPMAIKGQSLELLRLLYANAGHVCGRQYLVEKVFHETYRAGDEAQIGRLNVAIRRLREKIETDPDNPRYVFTDGGGGYRLQPKGD